MRSKTPEASTTVGFLVGINLTALDCELGFDALIYHFPLRRGIRTTTFLVRDAARG
jgi:hypothetical protein